MNDELERTTVPCSTVPTAVFEATRALLWVDTASDAHRVAEELVTGLGCSVVRRSDDISMPSPPTSPSRRRSRRSGSASRLRERHGAGLPVIVGGRTLGDDPSRAVALGADAWAPDASTAAEILARWRESPPAVDPLPRRSEPQALALFDRVTASNVSAA